MPITIIIAPTAFKVSLSPPDAAVLPIVTLPMPLDEALVEQAALRLGWLLAVGARLNRP